MDSSKQDYQYLRPPKEVFDIKHSDDYASRGEGNQSLRKIFAGVPFTEFEREKLTDFKKLVRNENLTLPSGWTDADYMRYVYSGRFNLEKCLDNLKTHIQWRSDPKRVVLGEKATKMIKDGLVYISGRDRQYRPIIIINVYKIDLKSMDMEDFNDALCFVLDVARNYYFVPGKVENWILIIETNSLSVFNFPFKVFKGIVQATGANFPCTSEKMFVTNPSRLFGASWNVAKGMLDPVTASKISVLTKDQFNDFFQYIAPEQLEQRYGGRLANPVSYWPPVNTLNKPPYIQGQEKGANVMASINLFGRGKSSQVANQEQNDQINEKTVYYDFDSSTESLHDLKDENNGETNFYSMESLDPRDQLSPKSYQETAQRKKFSVFFNPKTSVKPKKINLDDSLNGSDTSIASEKASEICRQMISMKSFHNNIACGGPRLRPSRPFERKGISKFGK